jgi:uncharacterized protein
MAEERFAGGVGRMVGEHGMQVAKLSAAAHRDAFRPPQQFPMINDPDDSYDIVHSPLARTLSNEGHTLRIDIYRGEAELDWILELEDELGTSTVFDERFATDQAALDAALAEIEAMGGIHRFCANAQAEVLASEAELLAKLSELEKEKAPSGPSATALHQMLEPLTDDELNELDRMLLSMDAPEGMTLDTLDGFLHAIVIGPLTLTPSRWLPKIWAPEGGEMMPPMNSLEQVNRLMSLIMRHHNSIVDWFELKPPAFAPLWPMVEFNGSEAEDAENWAFGFTQGVKLSQAAWQPLLDDPRGQAWYHPIAVLGDQDAPPEWDDLIRTPEQRAALTDQIEASVLAMHAHWLPLRQAVAERRTAQAMSTKVGRNEPCPCGSGKKFKKCCGSPVELH